MNRIYFFLVIISFCWSIKGFTQTISTPLLKDFIPNGRVIELTFAPEYEGLYFMLATYNGPNDTAFKGFFARSGTHCYELRDLDNWNGKINFLVTDQPINYFKNIQLIRPSFINELDLFLAPDRLTPKTINLLGDITLFSYPFSYALVTVFVFNFICIWLIQKKGIFLPLLISGLITFFLMDIRMIIKHWQDYQTTEKTYPYLDTVASPLPFLEKAKPILKEGTWTFRDKFKVEYYKLFIKYKLADIPFVIHLKKDTYIITEKPKPNQKILCQKNGFFLVK